jgi:hypothetical protein
MMRGVKSMAETSQKIPAVSLHDPAARPILPGDQALRK